MNVIKQTHISLKRGETLKLISSSGRLHLECSSGASWITVSNDTNDYILEAGHTLNIEPSREIVIEGLSEDLEVDIKTCA